MRGAPQVAFSATMRKIKARTSLLTGFRPTTWLILETHVQYKRNPARCQFTTVLGVTKTRGCLHPDQHILNATQNSLCRAVNRRRGRCTCSASNCRRRAMFSRTRSARQLSELTNQPRKCRSDTIMARILAERPNQTVRQVIDFAGVRPFGEAQHHFHLVTSLHFLRPLFRRRRNAGRSPSSTPLQTPVRLRMFFWGWATNGTDSAFCERDQVDLSRRPCDSRVDGTSKKSRPGAGSATK